MQEMRPSKVNWRFRPVSKTRSHRPCPTTPNPRRLKNLWGKPVPTAWPSPSEPPMGPINSSSNLAKKSLPCASIYWKRLKRAPGLPDRDAWCIVSNARACGLINRYGGKLESAVGIPAEQLRRAARSAVCKINIDSDGRLAMTAMIRQVFAEKLPEFDPRKYLGPARDELVKMVKHKNIKVLGSADRA